MKSDKILNSLIRDRHVPLLERAQEAISSFSLIEKIIFYLALSVFLISGIYLLWQVNNAFLVEVPAHGGSLEEGIVGTPRFINPLLAISEPDRDLTALVYSGLLKATPEGALLNDLAASYTVSDDGLAYTVVIRADAYFHDGKPVTADDVVFTIGKAQDSLLKSPKRANWEGVVVEKLSANEVRFVLGQPYTPFLFNLTLGILPKHIWGQAASDQFAFSQHNLEPIGSGPYKIASVRKNSGGFPVAYELRPFKNYSLGEPFIDNLTIKVYPNESELISAYQKGTVRAINSISPESALKLKDQNERVETAPLPRVFGLFFNQNQAAVFTNREVRRALDLVLNKELIIDQVLRGFGQSIDSPFPAGTPYDHDIESPTTNSNVSGYTRAEELLTANGWERNPDSGIWEKETKTDSYTLSFSITTGNTPDLRLTAELLKAAWESFGAAVDIKIFETGDLNQNIIRPRKYDALLFGEIVGHDLDLYPFWHSSQRNDPGLNIALYTNITVDKLLQDLRIIADPKTRENNYRELRQEIVSDAPAVFIYSPDFVYVVPKSINNLRLGRLTTPSERFLNIHEWYIETNKIWKFFTN